MDTNEQIWVVTPKGGPEYLTRIRKEADRAHAQGHKVEVYLPPAEEPDSKTPLHSVSISTTNSSPFSATILIDGREPQNIEAIYTELNVKEPNRCIIVFHPEVMEVDGQFEGWARPGGPEDHGVRKLLEEIRDKDEQLSDGSLGHLARQALDRLDKARPSYTTPGGPIQARDCDSPHIYTSTACQHGQHDLCRHDCKYCGAPCRCSCHTRPVEDTPTPLHRTEG